MNSADKFRQKLAKRQAHANSLVEYRNAFRKAQEGRLLELNRELRKLLDNIPKRCFFIALNEQSLEVKISEERVLSPNPDFLIKIKPSYRMRNDLDPPGYSFISEPGFNGSIKRSYGPWVQRVNGTPVSFSAHSDQALLDLIAEEMVDLMLRLDER